MSIEKISSFKNFYSLIKSFQIIALILIIFSLIFILISSPSKGYELSIYTMYPIFFWGALILSIVIGISTGAISIFHKQISLFKYSITIIIINYIIFLSLSTIRNYFLPYFGWNDALFHLGIIQNIFNTGHVDQGNVYPCIHIFFGVLQLFSIEKEVSLSFTPIFFYFLMGIFLLILARFFTKSNNFTYLIILLSLPLQTPLWHINKPSIIILIFIILLFFFVLKIITFPKQQQSYFFLLLLVFIFIMLSHPLTMVFGLFLLILLIISLKTLKIPTTTSSTYFYFLIVLLGSIFIFYSLTNPSISWSLSKFLSVLFSDAPSSTNVLQGQITYAQTVGTNYRLIVQRIVQTYGNHIIYLILIIILFIYYIKNIKKMYINLPLFFPTVLIIGSLIFGAFLTLGLLVSEPIRVLAFILLFSPLFILMGWCNIVQEPQKGISFVNILFILLIISSVFLGIFNFYTSPWMGQVNEQTSHKEYQGISWFLSKRDPEIFLDTSILNLRVWPHYYYSTNTPPLNNYQVDKILSHFGYNQKRYVGEIIDAENRYYTTTEIMKVAYLSIDEDRRQTVKQFLPEDFQRLNLDITANKIYANENETNGFDIWFLKKYKS